MSMDTNPPSRMVFINLTVVDLQRSMAFWRALGFAFNPQFTDESAACMILSEQGYVMLMSEARFKDFTHREVCDRRTHTEGLFALSCVSRAEVDHLVNTAVTSGGAHAMPVMDYGWMYGWSFYDPDGHHWEVMYMDPAGPPQEAAG